MKYIFFFLFLLTAVYSNSQTWNKEFGTLTNGWSDIARNIEYRNDSIYLVYSDSNPTGGRRINFSNISLEGDVVWLKTIQADTTIRNGGTSNSADFSQILNKFVLAQQYQTSLDGFSEIFLGELVVLNEHFDTLKTIIVGDTLNYYVTAQARFTTDNGYVAVGWSDDENITTQSGILLLKYNNEGVKEWQTIETPYNNHVHTAYSVVPLENGHYVTGGSLRQAINTPNRPMLTLFDENGDYIDHRLFGNDEYSEGWAKINPLADGNFIMCATKKESDDYSYYYLAKLDSSLNILWEKEYDALSQESAFLQLKENEDGSLIGVGVWFDPPTAYQYGVIMKFDSEGERIWERKYQHADEGWAQLNVLYDVIEIPENGGYVACGQRNELDTGQNAWVIKVDDMGCLVAGCDTLTSISEITRIEDFTFSLGPNPATDYLNVFIPELPAEFRSSSLALKLVNLEGKTVFSQALNTLDVTFIMDVTEYSRGVYYLSLVSEGVELNTQKVILK